MPMIVISDSVMCCTECRFQFESHCTDVSGNNIVFHPDKEMYAVFDGKTHHACPNTGKSFRFPEEKPIEGIEVE
jgi:hypothetical protein